MTRKLLEYAKNEIELQLPEGDGSPLRAHLETRERVSRRQDPRLHAERPAMAHIWDWFVELSSCRGGLVPLSYSEIRAWSVLTDVSRLLGPEEVGLIKAMDSMFLSAARKNKWLST